MCSPLKSSPNKPLSNNAKPTASRERRKKAGRGSSSFEEERKRQLRGIFKKSPRPFDAFTTRPSGHSPPSSYHHHHQRTQIWLGTDEKCRWELEEWEKEEMEQKQYDFKKDAFKDIFRSAEANSSSVIVLLLTNRRLRHKLLISTSEIPLPSCVSSSR